MPRNLRRFSRRLMLLAAIVLSHVLYVLYRKAPLAHDGASWFNTFSTPIFERLDTMALSRKPVVAFVDVLIGTGGEGHVFPGPSMPHGMVKVGIDTTTGLPPGYSLDGNVTGISHLHVSGTGMCIVTEYYFSVERDTPGMSSHIERVSVGYYGVTLPEFYADVEFTSSHRSAIHRYTWLKKGKGGVMFDIGHMPSEFYNGGSVEIEDGSRLTGPGGAVGTRVTGKGLFRETWSMGAGSGERGYYSVFFCADINMVAAKVGIWRDDNVEPAVRDVEMTYSRTGAYVNFPVVKNQTTEVRVGLSFVGVEEACKNLAEEVDKKTFEDIVNESVASWEEALQAIQLEGATDDQQKIFYSSLYRTMLMPVNRTGDNPRWKSDEPYWDDFYCIWDTFRSVHPLYTLIRPQVQSSIVRSLIDIQKNEGFLPDSRVANWNGRTQAGSNADVVLADAFVKGLEGIDWEAGWTALVADAENKPDDFLDHGRGDIDHWWSAGYVPSYPWQAIYHHRSAARTVEYAYNDFCISQVAFGLGKHSEYVKYLNSSAKWQNLWNDNITNMGTRGFIIPREEPYLGGGFLKDEWEDVTLCSPINWRSDICHFWNDEFYESSSWTYSLFVMQDVATLVKLTGGPVAYTKRLDTFFAKNLFDPGNEPSFLTPFMYNYVGRNDRTVDITREIIANNYTSKYDGIPGNDDSGAMGSWYVFTTLGFFPVAGQDLYLIASPHFPKSTIYLDPTNSAKTFTIVAHNLSERSIYVQRARLGNRELTRNWFRHTEIIKGAVLELWMGKKPSKWGRDKKDWPPSYPALDFRITPIETEENTGGDGENVEEDGDEDNENNKDIKENTEEKVEEEA